MKREREVSDTLSCFTLHVSIANPAFAAELRAQTPSPLNAKLQKNING
jgi:hypothetical protein